MRVVETVLEAEQSLFLNGRNDIWREEREENRGGYGGEYATSDVRCSRHLRLIFKGKLLSLGLLHGGRTRCPPLRLKKDMKSTNQPLQSFIILYLTWYEKLRLL